MSSDFVHMHRHSEFSPLDGTGNANHYAEVAATRLQHDRLGLTDHGGIGGALDHVRACRLEEKELANGFVDVDSELHPGQKRHKDERIIPIVGMEAFWVGGDPFGSRLDKESYEANKKPHLCLHASGSVGWHNLIRIVTESNHKDAFYAVPRVDLELLERYSEGIVASTACISSPVARSLLDGDYEGALKFVRELQRVLDGRVWVEIMGHDVDKQRQVNPGLVNLSEETGAGLIATTDAHYPVKEWSSTQELVFMMSRKDTFKKREEKASERGDEVYGKDLGSAYLMSSDEIRELFVEQHPDIPAAIVNEAIANTKEMASSIKPYLVAKDPKYPKASETPEDAEQTLREWCEEGFRRELDRRGDSFKERIPEYRERLEFELGTIRDKGVLDYFVIVADVVRWAKSEGIRVGPGRGSAAGCLLSYLVGITGVDPITYGLLFERFLNPDRKGYPDIDVDFQSEHRDRIISYLRERYGENNVANVITYQTFGPRKTLTDMTKVFDLEPDKIDFMDVKKVKELFGALDKDLAKLSLKYPELHAFAKKYPDQWEHMIRIDDMVAGPSKHASAVVIADRPIAEYAPVVMSRGRKKDGSDDTQVVAWADRAAFPIISEYGLFKMDVLGLEELDKAEHACKMIAQEQQMPPELDDLPVMWDPEACEDKVLDLFRNGLTLGLFQFASEGMTKLLRKISPDSVSDIIAANALYRPGAMSVAYDYAKRKNGEVPESEWYWHDAVEPFLKETYGVMVFQEQVMELVKAIGGFTPGQADDIRKAMSKLYRLPGDQAQQFMAQFKEQWDEGCRENSVSEGPRETIWAQILDNGDYSFNKSHAASYGLVAVQGGFLKAFHTRQFYAALLTRHGSIVPADIIREANSLGVRIKRPDINQSQRGFSLHGDELRYGLIGIKNVGGAAVHHIEDARPFDSFEDFLTRCEADKGEWMNLVKAGAFDEVADRFDLLSEVDKTEEPRWEAEFQCGATKKGIRRHPKEEFERDEDGEIARYKSGPKRGDQKRLKPILCPVHKDEECKMVEADSYKERWTAAEHFAHNLGLKNPNMSPTNWVQPSQNEVAEQEREVMGISLTKAEALSQNSKLVEECVHTQEEFEELDDGDEVIVAGEISRMTPRKIKKGRDSGREMCFFDVRYGSNMWTCKMWADTFARYKNLMENSFAVIAYGRRDEWKDDATVTVTKMQDLEEFAREEQN